MLRPDEAIWRYGTNNAARRQRLSYFIPPSPEIVRRNQTYPTSARGNGDICDVEHRRTVRPSSSDAIKQMAIVGSLTRPSLRDLNVEQRSSRITFIAFIVFGRQHAHAFVVLFAFQLAPLLGRHTFPAQSL